MRSSAALAALLALGGPALAQLPGLPQGAPHPEVIYPDTDIPLPEGFTISREVSRNDNARKSPDTAAINLPRDVPARLSACWTPPPAAQGESLEITVRLSFTNDGAVIGAPATPYLHAGTDDARRALRQTLLDAIRACTPLRFTPSLGKAIAGRIFAIRYIVHSATREKRP